MTNSLNQTLKDSKRARWIALIILSFTMFAGYMFTEVISPLKPIIERTLGMNSTDFGFITSAYGVFNVFLAMLIIVGILLDKFGIRFSTTASALIMIIGGTIKYAAFKDIIGNPEHIISILNLKISTQVFWAGFGFAIFGVGVEYAGITVSKSVAKWFKGKEIALAGSHCPAGIIRASGIRGKNCGKIRCTDDHIDCYYFPDRRIVRVPVL